MNETCHEIGEDLVALGLKLGVEVMLGAVVHLDLPSQGHNLKFVAFLSALELCNVGMVHIPSCLKVGSFPHSECFVLDQPINSFN
jgi:hypothetical protein